MDEFKKSVSVDFRRDEGRVAGFEFKSKRVHFYHLRNSVQEQDKYWVNSFAGNVSVSVCVLIFITDSEKRHSLGHQSTAAFFITGYLHFTFFLGLFLLQEDITFFEEMVHIVSPFFMDKCSEPLKSSIVRIAEQLDQAAEQWRTTCTHRTVNKHVIFAFYDHFCSFL